MRFQKHAATPFTSLLALLLAVGLIGLIGCKGGEDNDGSDAAANPTEGTPETDTTTPRLTPTSGSDTKSPFNSERKVAPVTNPVVIFRTSHGEITVELDAKKAPQTVDKFLMNYVDRGFYNDTIFHYVEAGMIVGGGYDTNNEFKEPREPIRCEADNGLSNQRGTLAMARSPEDAHSATSQFFFNLKDNTDFDHQSTESPTTYGYCVFGKVTGGLAVLDKIAGVATTEGEISPSFPAEPVVIRTVEVIKR